MNRILYLSKLLVILLFACLLAAHAEPIQGGDKDTVWMRYTPQSAYMVKISHTNKYIAEFGEGYTYFYDFNTGEQIKYLDGNWYGFFINNDQNFIRVNKNNNSIEIWDINSWQIIASMPNGETFPDRCFANISKNEKYMAVNTANGFKIWDIGQRKLIKTKVIPLYENQIGINTLAIQFNCDNNVILQLAKTYNNPIKPDEPFVRGCFTLFDFNTLDSIDCLWNGRYMVISNNCQTSALNISSVDQGVQVYNLLTKKLLWTLPTDGTNLTGMGFSPNDKYLVTVHGPDANVLNVWEIATGDLKFQIHNTSFESFDISDDGKYWVSTVDRYLILWKANYGTTSVRDPKTPQETIFPNPTNGLINLIFTNPSPAITNISVVNLTGKNVKLLFNGFLNQRTQRLSYDVKGLPPGSYFVQIQNKTYSKIFKLIINK